MSPLMEKGGKEMIPQIKKILYATDLSKNSSYAFLFATDIARRHDAKIVILHVFEPTPAYVEVYSDMTDEMKRKQREETLKELKKHLQGFCRKVEAQIGPPCIELVSKILVSVGHPPEEILNTANEEGCDRPGNPRQGIFGPCVPRKCLKCGIASNSKTGFHNTFTA
jgi:nucleotide-binding universal stress UspA family protein